MEMLKTVLRFHKLKFVTGSISVGLLYVDPVKEIGLCIYPTCEIHEVGLEGEVKLQNTTLIQIRDKSVFYGIVGNPI